MTRLFVIDLTYFASLVQVERHLPAHREYLARHYASGVFLASGPKHPRTGGVILAAGSRAEIDELVREDPFWVEGVADHRITEFEPTMIAAGSDRIREIAAHLG